MQVHELVGFHKTRRSAHKRAHDVDILRHDLLRTGALHLHGNVLAAHELGTVHLRERCAAERLAVDPGEHLAHFLAVLGLQAVAHHPKRHGFHVGAQTAQLVAELLGQNLGPVGKNLPHLDEHGAELLEQAAQAHGRQIVPRLVFAHERKDLRDALAPPLWRELVLLGGSHDLRLFWEGIDGARAAMEAARGHLLLVGEHEGIVGIKRLVARAVLGCSGLGCHMRRSTRPSP